MAGNAASKHLHGSKIVVIAYRVDGEKYSSLDQPTFGPPQSCPRHGLVKPPIFKESIDAAFV
jgi:hypothetical protein